MEHFGKCKKYLAWDVCTSNSGLQICTGKDDELQNCICNANMDLRIENGLLQALRLFRSDLTKYVIFSSSTGKAYGKIDAFLVIQEMFLFDKTFGVVSETCIQILRALIQ